MGTAKDNEEKQLAARYRDLPCILPVEEIQVAPICQRGGLSASTTTEAASTTETTTQRHECPDGWETFTGSGSAIKCFKFYSTTVFATSAENNCQGEGGHLASIHSIQESNFIQEMFENSATGAWIGGVDRNHDGLWEWTDGSFFDFSNWSSNQPNGGEYFILLGRDGEWRDWTASGVSNYICQITF